MRLPHIIILSLIMTTALLSQTHISGTASGLWTVDYHPFILTADATVPEGDTLVIEDRVEVDLGGEFSLRVEGVLISNGSNWRNGGELFNTGGAIHLENCLFDSLTGGIRVYSGSAFISSCTIDNTAETGITLNGTDSSFVLNSEILNSGDYGLKVRATDDVVVTGNLFTGNSTNDFNHPALFIDSASPETITNNVIRDNHAQGIGVWSLSSMSAPRITYNLVSGNFTGITLVNAPVFLENNIIVANYYEGNSNSGAGVYAGYSNSNPILMHNYIAGNYYGVSNINSAACNLGDMVNDYPGDDGMNIFLNNGVDGELWNIWNGTPSALMAQNNYWPGLELSEVDATLYDDEEGGGEIIFEPIYAPALPRLADVNGDTMINVLDVVLIVEGIVSGDVPSGLHFYLSDVNEDYDLNVQDIVALVELIVSD